MIRTSLNGLVLLLAALPAAAEIRVAATTPNMGMLAETIGGDAVGVTVMAPHDRDVHYLEARPSMMAALRRADMVSHRIYQPAEGAQFVGSELGWHVYSLPGHVEPGQNEQAYFAIIDQYVDTLN